MTANITTKKRPCADIHPNPAESQGKCHLCKLFIHDFRYRELWGGISDSHMSLATLNVVPCANEGNVLEVCYGCQSGERHVRECDVHGKCTRDYVSDKVQSCVRCSSYQPDVGHRAPGRMAKAPFPERLKWVSTAQLIQDSISLAAFVPPDCAGIVGIPRSGMLPAATISTHLHLPLFSLESHGPRPIQAGSRGGTVRSGRGPFVVIDDTVYGGSAMVRARVAMGRHHAIFAAVYVRPESLGAVDILARPLPSPHLLEWNMTNNGPFSGAAVNPVYGSGVACDFDGIFCHDEESGGPVGEPYLLPKAHSVRLIATGRPERSRAGTEAWLRKYGIRWERLAMLPDDVPLTWQNAAEHKSREYAASKCGFFLESCPEQSRLIFEATGKPVICPVISKVFCK